MGAAIPRCTWLLCEVRSLCSSYASPLLIQSVRFLKAEDWKVDAAKKRLEETLVWRREYKPDLIPPSEIQEETEGGKIVVTGFTFKVRISPLRHSLAAGA